MNKKSLSYIIPLYYVWGLIHMGFFIRIFVTGLINNNPFYIPSLVPLFISHFLLMIIGLFFFFWMLVDCALREYKKESEKIIWIVVIILFSFIGATVYYYVHGKEPLKKKK